jgi:hypothetical protein
MSLSIMSLCDRALSFIGGKRLVLSEAELSAFEALDYETLASAKAQQEAVVCALHFGAVRDSLFESYPWVFAKKSAELAELSAAVGGWAHSYALPADCARILEIIAGALSLPDYEIAGGSVSCNYERVIARYTRYENNVSKWPPCFRDAFCAKLAMEIAGAVTGNFSLAQDMRQIAAAAVQEGYRLGLIDERPALPMDLYQWDKYFNDASAVSAL